MLVIPQPGSTSSVAEIRFAQSGADYDSLSGMFVLSGIEGFTEFIPSLLESLEFWRASNRASKHEWSHLGRTMRLRLVTTDEIILTQGQALLGIAFRSLLMTVEFRMVVDASSCVICSSDQLPI